MEENIIRNEDTGAGFLRELKEVFNLRDNDIRTYSPLNLAYIGDSVYELSVRSMVVCAGNSKPDTLHNNSIKYEKAATQSKLFDLWTDSGDILSDEEADILRRGRNAKPYSKAKNATALEYRKATAVETLMGYLYMTGNTGRMLTLLKDGFESIDI